jgi:hypothetical protein
MFQEEMMQIKRGILQTFQASTYTASVLLPEATSTYLQGVPVNTALDAASAVPGAFCALLFFDEANPQDAVVLAVYPNGTQGIPSGTNGVTFVAGYQQITNVTISSGTTQTFTLTGGSSGIPTGATGVIYKVYFSSPSSNVNIYIQLAPHGGIIGSYGSVGNTDNLNQTINGMGVLQIDSNGKIDIKANNGDCVVNLFTHGYIL